MLEYMLLLLSLARAAVRDREALVAENLLLRHQLAVLTRPTRKRSRLRTRDKLFWVVVRALRRDWRRHLVMVRPEKVLSAGTARPGGSSGAGAHAVCDGNTSVGRMSMREDMAPYAWYPRYQNWACRRTATSDQPAAP
jgi:hypothetical protein